MTLRLPGGRGAFGSGESTLRPENTRTKWPAGLRTAERPPRRTELRRRVTGDRESTRSLWGRERARGPCFGRASVTASNSPLSLVRRLVTLARTESSRTFLITDCFIVTILIETAVDYRVLTISDPFVLNSRRQRRTQRRRDSVDRNQREQQLC